MLAANIGFKKQIEMRVVRILIVASVIAGVSCDQNGENKSFGGDSHHEIKNDTLSLLKEGGKGRRPQAGFGVSVLHEPTRKSVLSPIIELSSGVCFDASKLPKPWFFTGIPNYRRSSDGFGLAIRSDSINIPYYKVVVPDDVNYEFVTRGQEFLTVVVLGATKADKINYESKVNKEKYKLFEKKEPNDRHQTFDVVPYENEKLIQVEDWNFKIYQSVRCRHCDDGPYFGSPFYIVDHERDAFVRQRLSAAHWTQKNWVSKLRPTDGFFNAPTLEGKFLHSSGLFTAEFVSSGRATLNAPEVFKNIDDVVTNLMSDCKG